MDRVVEKSVFVTAARLGLMRLKAPPGSARETGSGKQEKLVCTPGSTIDGPGLPGWAGLLCSQAGLGAGNGSGAWPWPECGPAQRDRTRLGWNLQALALEAMDVMVGKISGSDTPGGEEQKWRGLIPRDTLLS